MRFATFTDGEAAPDNGAPGVENWVFARGTPTRFLPTGGDLVSPVFTRAERLAIWSLAISSLSRRQQVRTRVEIGTLCFFFPFPPPLTFF